MKIVETVTETPEQVATKVVLEDGLRWNVQCEGTGCTNTITVGKRTLVPVDWRNRPDDYREVRLSAPEARRCSLHGPKLSR